MARNFVALTVETEVVRRRRDAAGAFVRGALGEDCFPTSSGYFASISASGRHLGDGLDLKRAMAAFRRLPEAERAPRTVQIAALVSDGDDAAIPPAPPERGLVLRVFARLMARTPDGAIRRAVLGDFPLMPGPDQVDDRQGRLGYLVEPTRDHVWLTESEWRELLPSDPKVGNEIRVPAAVTHRIARFHLVPARTWGEGGEWSEPDVRVAEVVLSVTEETAETVRLSARGRFAIGSVFDADKATTPNGPLKLGYEADVVGELVYDRLTGRFAQFDLLAQGDVWGRMGDANGRSCEVERPGRTPLLFSFALADGKDPLDRLVPTGRTAKIRTIGYFDAGE